jgi:uncharacterized protein (TIGR02922 family)
MDENKRENNEFYENSHSEEQLVTILYYSDISLELMHAVLRLPQNQKGRVVIPDSFKTDKSIVAVCEGEVFILNKIGDRV